MLPRTRSEDRVFRELLARGQVQWRHIHDKRNDTGKIVDQYSVSVPVMLSVEGYRLVWYHSTRKAEQDARARHLQVERAMIDLAELRQKLSSPRTRYRQAAKVAEAVQGILKARGVEDWIVTEIKERTEEKYRQDRRGRPSAETRYVKETSTRFELEYHIDTVRLAAETCGDGVFPLITNDYLLSELELLLAYKGQPSLEKRFTHMKTDFDVAPVYLNDASRIQALLCVYFLALLTESLLERELRRAMERKVIASLPLYPEVLPGPVEAEPLPYHADHNVAATPALAEQPRQPPLGSSIGLAGLMGTGLAPLPSQIRTKGNSEIIEGGCAERKFEKSNTL